MSKNSLKSNISHESLTNSINNLSREVNNYIPLISNGLISVMVAHLAVKNNDDYNTGGLPATCSKRIVTDLLKDSLGFRGLIVTDALNMGAVTNIEQSGLILNNKNVETHKLELSWNI